jgi:hypothetical protein
LSYTRLIVSFLLIAVVVSAALAYVGAIIATLGDAITDWEYLVFGPIFVAPFYAIFLVLGGLIFGMPTLVILRRNGLSTDPRWLIPSGAFAGMTAGLVLLGGWLGFGTFFFAVPFGLLGGLMSATLWYLIVEKPIGRA